MEFYKALYSWGRRVEVNVFPLGTLWNECGAVVYCLSNLVLELCGRVSCRCLKVVFVYKILYFTVVLLDGEYDYGVAFVSRSNCGIILQVWNV